MLHRTTPFFVTLLGTAALVAAEVRAQCSYAWPATFGTGCNEVVRAATFLGDGHLVAAGAFTDANGVPADRIAHWDGSVWAPLGTGCNGTVSALAVLPNGDLCAGGAFTTAGGTTVNCVARWNGATWSAFGTGVAPVVPFGASVQALAVMPNGDLVIGGNFASVGGVACTSIARWNGSVWAPLGTGCNGTVRGLAVASNGDVLSTGGFTHAGGVLVQGIARWNGAQWSALGTGLGFLGGNCVAVAGNGDVLAGGIFTTAGGGAANRVARWNGAAWSGLGTGTNDAVTALRVLPNGDVLAGGAFTSAGGLAANRIAKWNGTAWAPLAGGTDGLVQTLALGPLGDVVAGGAFTNANGGPASRIARITSSCAPTAASVGAGCTGAGGPNVLVATQLPSVGGTFRATGTGMPPIGLVVAVTGLAPLTLPLAAVLPQALPGCTLHTTADLLDVLVPAAGAASSSLAFPSTPALAGAQFFHQYVPLELDLAFNITAVTATNGLQLTIGTF